MTVTLKITVKNPGELQRVIDYIESSACPTARVQEVQFPFPTQYRNTIGLSPLAGTRS